MDRRIALGAIALASVLMTGCASLDGDPVAGPAAQGQHRMIDGSEMPGSQHGSHELEARDSQGPSEAALMVCDGQVRRAVTKIFGLARDVDASPSWDEPVFSCTYDIDGAPLIVSVYDASEPLQGAGHFAELQNGFPNAREIEGMAALGMPSFSTDDGIVAFLREGKTLLVDATALPAGLGADRTRTQEQAAYSLASAVLACWTEHD